MNPTTAHANRITRRLLSEVPADQEWAMTEALRQLASAQESGEVTEYTSYIDFLENALDLIGTIYDPR